MRPAVTPARFVLIGLLGLAFLAPTCSRRETPPSEIVIGATLPLSGSDAALAPAVRRGYERAVAEANAAGGLVLAAGQAPARVRLDVRDDESRTPVAEDLVGVLADAGALLVVATPNAVRAAAQAVVAERLHHVLVVSAVDAPGLPSPHMEWVVAIDADGGAEERGYHLMRAAIGAIASAEAPSPRALRLAFGARK